MVNRVNFPANKNLAMKLWKDYQKEEISARRVIEELIPYCIEIGSAFHCFRDFCFERALAQADRIDDERRRGSPGGRLAGLPISIKEMIDVRGLITRRGSAVFEDLEVAKHDAPIVEQLECEGALIIGTNQTHEFAFGPTGDIQIGNNPIGKAGPNFIPGGSSSGSAVAVAAGAVAAAIATDTGGSTRTPAAHQGVFGMKMPLSDWATTNVAPLSNSLDSIGIIASDYSTLLSLANVISDAPKDEIHERSKLKPISSPSLCEVDIQLLDTQGSCCTNCISSTFKTHTENFLSTLPKQKRALPVPWRDLNVAHATIVAYEAYEEYGNNLDLYLSNGLSYDTYLRIQQGRKITRSKYALALSKASEFIQYLKPYLRNDSLLLSPTTGTLATRPYQRHIVENGLSLPVFRALTTFTSPFNFASAYALNIPICADTKHRGFGIQVISARPLASHLVDQLQMALRKACRVQEF